MNTYEMICVLRPDFSGEEKESLITKVKESIEKKGGVITTFNDWGTRKLACPIKQFFDATYILLQFTLNPNHINDIKREYNVSDAILRYLLIQADQELGKRKEKKKPLETISDTSNNRLDEKKQPAREGGDYHDRTNKNAGTE